MFENLKKWQANILLLVAAMLFGSAFIPQSWASQYIGAFLFSGLRFSLGALVVFPLAFKEYKNFGAEQKISFHSHKKFMGMLGLFIALGVGFQQIGLETTTVTNAGVLTSLYVPFTSILVWILFLQKPHWMVLLCCIACVVGTWLLTGGGYLYLRKGDIWVIICSVFWALHIIFSGRLTQRVQGAYALSFVQFLSCSVICLAISFVVEPWQWHTLKQAMGGIFYTGVFVTGVAYTLQMIGQKVAHVTSVAIILSSETIFAALFGMWFMRDKLTIQGWIGALLIIISILVVPQLPAQKMAQ